jgi:hypothetical protein
MRWLAFVLLLPVSAFAQVAGDVAGMPQESAMDGSGFMATDLTLQATGKLIWSTRSRLTSPADGNLLLTDAAGTDAGMLQFGGTTAAYPALKRSGADLQIRLADDSDFGILYASYLVLSVSATIGSSASFNWSSRTEVRSPADAQTQFCNAAETQCFTLDASAADTMKLWDKAGTGGGNLHVTGTVDAESYMSIGDGMAPMSNKTLCVDRDFTSSTTANQIYVDGSITVDGGTSDIVPVYVAPTGVDLDSGGAHGIVASMAILEPMITETSGTATEATVLYVGAAPTEGDANSSLHVLGAVDFDSTLNVDGAATFGANVLLPGVSAIHGEGSHTGLPDNVATSFLRIAVATDTHEGGAVFYGVHAQNASDVQVTNGMVTFALVNDGGTEICDVQESVLNQSSAVSAGSLAVTFSCDASPGVEDVVDLDVTSNTTLGSLTTHEIHYTIVMNDLATITAQ